MTWWFFVLPIFIGPLLLWLMWREDFDGMKTESRMKRRPKLTLDEFYAQFYSESEISKSTIARLLDITADQFGIHQGQIRPDDNFHQTNLGATIYYVMDIAEEFEIPDRISDGDKFDGTFDNIARHIAHQLKCAA